MAKEKEPVAKVEVEPEEKPVEIIPVEEPPKGRVERKLDVITERIASIEKGIENFGIVFGKDPEKKSGEKVLPGNHAHEEQSASTKPSGYPRLDF